jgi:hypothetical protein
MTLHLYGENETNLRQYLTVFSIANKYVAEHYIEAKCVCGNTVFKLELDDIEGVAIRICTECQNLHYIGDSKEFLERSELDSCECQCGNDAFEITVGVALYRESSAVKWMYIGARCVDCKIVGCFGDWKNEYENYADYLANV